ncbi:MAG TPA: toll/interleukin-1 receptor domain-containing protein [Pyrinomonadaceae bacterium]|nr:toll/interleukin-1 receptor domain-containing protein [Pyrinomonadaceae bacterium]
MPPKKIFICYRRDDAEGYAGRIYDRLHARFPGRVFMDVTGINPGADFSRVIQDTVGTSTVLLAIIGKQWLTIKDEADTPRIQKADDYVRHEIATALYRNIAVIPVLVREAKMPSPAALPPDLAGLSTRNALEISDDDFEHDALRLITAIEFVMGETRPVTVQPQPAKSNRTCLIVAIAGIVLGGGGLLLIIVLGLIIPRPNNNTNNYNYETPVPTISQQPQPSEDYVPEAEFDPIGNWTMQLTGNGETNSFPLSIRSDHTYQYGDEVGTWAYSGNSLTFSSAEGSITFTIEGRYGDGYSGHALVYGVPFQAILVRQ